MKKLLFMIAAVVAAVSAQAAYVDWQYSTAEAKSGGTDWTSGYTAYFLTATAWDGIKDNVTASALSGAALDSSIFYAAGSTKSQNKYSTGDTAAGVRQVDVGEVASASYYIILGTTSGYTVGVGPETIASYSDASSAGTAVTAITIQQGSAVDGAGLRTSIAGSPYSTGGGGVPEPTSGLLLALGGAMLALRRKRA